MSDDDTTDVLDYRERVEEALRPQGSIMQGGAWAKEYALGMAPVAYGLVGVAEELHDGLDKIADAISVADIGSELGNAIERGLDSMGQEIGQSIERGLSEIAKAVEGIGG